MTKKDSEKETEELNADWFEDHESYDADDDSGDEVEDLDSEEMEEYFEGNEEFDSRVKHFLSNQRKDVSLEKMVEIPSGSIEENLPARKEENLRPEENNFDYLTKPEDNGTMYKPVGPDTQFSRPDMSSSERVLEEQKALYSTVKRFGVEAQKNSDWKPITAEETQKKYIARKGI